MKDYEIIKAGGSENDLEKYKECFDTNGSDRSLDNLKWLHEENVPHTNMIYYAIEKEKNSIAAIYTALPVIASIEKYSITAMQSIDTLTDKQHRGKGLFILLAKRLYQDASERGFAFVYGFPNANSAPGFFKKLGWVSFGEVPFLIKPVRVSYFIKKLLKIKSKGTDGPITAVSENIIFKNNVSIKILNEFTGDYDRLWEIVAQKIKVSIRRDSTYMNWRYIKKPGEYYYKYGIYHNETLEAVVVFTLKNKHDGLIAYIMEFIYDPNKTSTAKRLLVFANKWIKSQKADVILAWCFPHSFNFKLYRKCGYFTLNKLLRPQKLFLGIKVLNPQFSEIISNINNWYISYSDSDTV